MFLLTGNCIEVIEKPAESRDGKTRPAYAVVQVVGKVIDFGGVVKSKIFDVASPDIAAAKAYQNKNVTLAVDVYGVGKGQVSLKHIPALDPKKAA
jgi:hypothetical protein